MTMNEKNNASKNSFPIPGRHVTSIRFIVTAAAIILITGVGLFVGGVAERNVRNTIAHELETRLVLESRNLALLSSEALLSDYPELILHPVVKEMKAERPDLAMIYVIDHNNIIQGNANVKKIGTRFKLDAKLEPIKSKTKLYSGESLLGNSELLVAETPIIHPNEQIIGRAIVGLERIQIETVIMEARKQQAFFLIAALIASGILTLFLMSLLLRPFSILREGLEKIGQGNLDAKVELSSKTEFGLLAQSINNMAATLKSNRQELIVKERLDHEMQLARDIQQALLPKKRLVVGDFIIVGAQKAADEVGGDYYNVFPISSKHLGLVIADVVGKGLGGCLITSMIDVLIKTLCPIYLSPSALLVALEHALVDSLKPGIFVTMFYGVLSPKTGDLTYTSAGHNPVLLYNSVTQQVSWHKTTGIPIGAIRGGELNKTLKDRSLNIAPHDLLVGYTDGITEAGVKWGEQFGYKRLEAVVRNFAPKGALAVINGLQKSVDEWEKQKPASDDKTLLILSREKSSISERQSTTEAGVADKL